MPSCECVWNFGQWKHLNLVLLHLSAKNVVWAQHSLRNNILIDFGSLSFSKVELKWLWFDFTKDITTTTMQKQKIRNFIRIT